MATILGPLLLPLKRLTMNLNHLSSMLLNPKLLNWPFCFPCFIRLFLFNLKASPLIFITQLTEDTPLSLQSFLFAINFYPEPKVHFN